MLRDRFLVCKLQGYVYYVILWEGGMVEGVSHLHLAETHCSTPKGVWEHSLAEHTE